MEPASKTFLPHKHLGLVNSSRALYINTFTGQRQNPKCLKDHDYSSTTRYIYIYNNSLEQINISLCLWIPTFPRHSMCGHNRLLLILKNKSIWWLVHLNAQIFLWHLVKVIWQIFIRGSRCVMLINKFRPPLRCNSQLSTCLYYPSHKIQWIYIKYLDLYIFIYTCMSQVKQNPSTWGKVG